MSLTLFVRAHERRAGYTLVELMVVVSILGILAAVALPTYNSYMKKSKTTEAVGFLAEIKARQEAYRADFGEYVNASGNSSNWNPDANPGITARAWVSSTGWTDLGAAPPGGQVLFSYQTVAGRPGEMPGVYGFDTDRGYTGNDFWFISSAIGDLDGDGTQVTFESYSASSSLFISEAAGWE